MVKTVNVHKLNAIYIPVIMIMMTIIITIIIIITTELI